MAEEQSLTDRLMAGIQKNFVINGIKEALKKFEFLRQILPVAKDLLENGRSQAEAYLGEADKIIVIGRKLGKTRIIILDGKKPFVLSNGMNIKCQKDGIEIKEVDSYLQEFYSMGIFDLISEEDNKKYLEMKEKGQTESFFQNLITGQKQIE